MYLRGAERALDSPGEAKHEALSEHEAAVLFSGCTSEMKIALLAAVKPGERIGQSTLVPRMMKLQSGDPLWNIEASAYTEQIKRLSQKPHCAFVQHAGSGSGFDVVEHTYELTEAGVYLYRPLAGHLGEWGYEHNVPLRIPFGETKVPAEGSNVLAPVLKRIAILAYANAHQEFSLKELHAALNKEDRGYPIDARSAGHALINDGLFHRLETADGIGYSLNPRYFEPLRALIPIFEGALRIDPAFYESGQQLADRFSARTDTMRYMLQRVGHHSKHDKQGMLDYEPFIDHAVRILDALGPQPRHEMVRRMGLDQLPGDLSGDRRRNIIRKVCQDPRIATIPNENPNETVFMREPAAISETSDAA